MIPFGLLLICAAAAASDFRLTVLHANDVHSHFDEDAEGFGGFSRMRGAMDRERSRALADGASVVQLYAGDTFFGTSFFDELGWEPAADFIGGLGFDVMTLGNHEFHVGPETLAEYLKSDYLKNIPIVCTNIDTKEEASFTNIKILPSKELTVDGHKIGIVGYLTPDTMWMNRVGKIVLNNEIKSLKKEVEKLKSNGVEFIIALGHSGLEMDRQVAREVDGVDVVVGGHSHTYLITGPPQSTETPAGPYPVIEKRGERIVPVVQAYAYAKYLGRLDLIFDSERRLISAVGGPILLDNTIPKDEITEEKVEKYKKKLAEAMKKQVIGKTSVFLDGISTCQETNLGNLIADSFVRFNLKHYLNNNETNSPDYWTDAAVAIILSSGIKQSINTSSTAGDILKSHVKTALPYLTPLMKITVSGKTLMEALEHCASLLDYKNCAIPEENIYGSFIQMSGMHVVYNMKNAKGSRVQSVMILCSKCKVPEYEPIDSTQHYTLITTKYLTNGGDKYIMIRDGIIDSADYGETTETDVVQIYVNEMSPIYAGTENRVQIIH